jgi:hypothetical protein
MDVIIRLAHGKRHLAAILSHRVDRNIEAGRFLAEN